MYNEFLREYVALEENLRKFDGGSVLDYEATLPPEQMEKLKVCRIMRNYARHHEDGKKFITPSRATVDFLHQLNGLLEASYLHVKDRMKKYKPLKPEMSLKDALGLLAKQEMAVVLDKDEKIAGVLDRQLLLQLLDEGQRTSCLLRTLSKDPRIIKALSAYERIRTDARLDEAESGVRYIVTDTKGNYKGLLFLPA